jgi:hypothetical protein
MSGKKYSIKEGVSFRPYGEKSLITSEMLTDEMAQMFLKKDPSLLGTVIVENEKEKTTKAKKTKK